MPKLNENSTQTLTAPKPDLLSVWQVSTFRQQVGTLFVIHLFAAIFLLWLTWHPSTLHISIAWASYFVVAWAGAGLGLLVVTAPARASKNPRRAIGAALVASLIWSSPWIFAVHLIVPGDPAARLATVCILIALAAGIAQTMRSYYPTTAISIFCILLPIAVFMVSSEGRFDQPLGICLLAFLCLYLIQCFRSSRAMLENTRLRLASEHTIEQLRDQVEMQTNARVHVEKALCVAEQACLDKSRFLAAASHDLRQPMHAISLFLAALKSEAVESRSRYLLDRLDRSLAGLDDLFNRLLDISHLDAGLIVPDVKTVDAFRIAQTLESRFMPVAAAKSLNFRVRCKPGLQLRSDPELLIELVTNLLSNAFRYTERGGILLSFRERGDHALIQIWDTGCGISHDHLGLIFDEFVQLNNPARDRRKGLGLGLAIVKRLAGALGHRIDVRSQIARGSTFSLQVERTEDSSMAPYELTQILLPGSVLNGALVLVVDDEIDILAAMEAILTSWGCLSILARSTEEAAKYVDSSLRFPDVIITDHRLESHRTSFDVAAAVAPLVPYEIPMIVISGESNPSLEKEINGMGWLLMNKPVNATRLYAAISHALQKTSESLSEVA